MAYPYTTTYPTRAIVERLLEEDRAGEEIPYAVLDGKEKSEVDGQVFFMLDMYAACGYFTDIRN